MPDAQPSNQPDSEQFRQAARKIAREMVVTGAQLDYMHSKPLIVLTGRLALKSAVWIGLPMTVIGWLIGNGDIARIGLWVLLGGLWVGGVGVAVMLPGWLRVTEAARARADQALDEAEAQAEEGKS